MATKQRNIQYRLDRSRLSVFDDSKYPVKVAKNGTPYVDVPGLGFYAGTHKGITYTAQDIKSLENTFVAPDPSDELFGSVPVMIDHSDSNRDKCGHIRSVSTIGDESHCVFRIIGKANIEALKEGKFRSLSAGISFSEEMPAEPPQEAYAEGDPLKQECAEGDQSEPSPEEEKAEGEMSEGETEIVKCSVAYDHMAFTPFPCLSDCKLYQRSPEIKTEIKTLRAETAKLSIRAEQFNAKQALNDRKRLSAAITENLIHKGKVTPAQRQFFSSFLSTLDDDQRDCFQEYMEQHAPMATPVGETVNHGTLSRPEEQKPIAAQAAVKQQQSNLQRLVGMFNRGVVKQK